MFPVLEVVLLCVFAAVYAWVFYTVPVLAAGVRNLRRSRQHPTQDSVKVGVLPSFSVVLPVKNEGKVVGRILKTLSHLNYPADKLEIVVVEDGSTDDTFEVCSEFACQHANIKVLQKSSSSGKPSALNYGLEHSSGDIVAIFDADNVPDDDALLKAAGYFADPAVAAVQGRTLSINSRENMLTQFISYEDTVWCEAYLRGKDALGLFVHLKGTGQFVRRSVLERLGGFNEGFLSEDMELSAHLTERGTRFDMRRMLGLGRRVRRV